MDIRHLTGRTQPVDPSQKSKQLDKKAPLTKDGQSFSQILEKVSDQKQQLQFSTHAMKRLEDRSIELSETDIGRIQDAVDRAGEKGSKESLILDGDNAYLVNVEDRKVITAVDHLEMRDRVFTQIDSAVLTDPDFNK